MPKGVYTTKKNVGFGQEWPEPAIAIMRRVLEGGGSFSTVVRHLADHGHRFTRNACIGKAKRMGIVSQNTSANTKAAGLANKRRASERRIVIAQRQEQNELLREEGTRTLDREPGGAGGYKLPRRSRTSDQIKEDRKPKAITPIVEAAPTTSKPFCDLRKGECRWPTTIECTEACGAPATIGSYCDKHAQVAYRAMPTPKRNAVITKTQDIDYKRDREADATISHFLDEPKMIGLSSPFMGPGSTFETAAMDAILEEIIDDD